MKISYRQLLAVASKCGLSLVGALSRDEAFRALSREEEHLKIWQENGYAGEMQYMLRPRELFLDLDHFLKEMQSVLCFVIPYNNQPAAHTPCPSGFGKVARYAWGKDYHRVLKKRLEQFIQIIQQQTKTEGTLRWRQFSDAVPLLERSLSSQAGLGFIGRNSMLIRKGMGSFFFLAEILWNLEIEGEDSLKVYHPEAVGSFQSCGTCSQCISSCPTSAIVADGIIDSRRCISYLTIEKRGILNSWERRAIGQWIFGCDICQDTCPFNHRGLPDLALEEFMPSKGAGSTLDLLEICQIESTRSFQKRFGETALMRAGREQMIRNACCVIANTRFEAAEGLLKKLAESDLSPLVRYHAKQAVEDLNKDACQR